MTFDEIKEKYGYLYTECNKTISDLKKEKAVIEKIKSQSDSELVLLQSHNINLHGGNNDTTRRMYK